MADPSFFDIASELYQWLVENHTTASELWIGFYKTRAKEKGITYAQALDEALAFGWIDAVRKSIDDTRWMIRFTPRKPRSTWSDANLKRVGELKELGRMQPSGLKAFEERSQKMSKQYSFENKDRQLDPAYVQQFKQSKKAWAFFQSQTPSYQHAASWWVISAPQELTRLKRLADLIENSANERRMKHLTPPKKRT